MMIKKPATKTSESFQKLYNFQAETIIIDLIWLRDWKLIRNYL